MTKSELNSKEYNEYYQVYLDHVDDETTLEEAYKKEGVLKAFFDNIPEEKLDYKYADEKWSVKEVFQHIIDTERIFTYRIFRIGRQDSTPLSGFDQDIYNDPSGASQKSLEQLQEEYRITRLFTSNVLQNITPEQLKFVGTASGFPASARAIAFTILGHEKAHIQVLKERYLL